MLSVEIPVESIFSITDILGIVDAITGLGGDKGGGNKGNNRRRGRGNARRRRNRQRGRGVRRAPSIDPIADSSAGRRLSPFQLEQARKTASAVDAPGAKPNLFQRLWNGTTDATKGIMQRGRKLSLLLVIGGRRIARHLLKVLKESEKVFMIGVLVLENKLTILRS